jgi:hypothetical protein
MQGRSIMSVRDLLVLYVRFRRCLKMLHLVLGVVGQLCRHGFPPCGSARWGFGHSPRVADFLDEDLVVRPSSQTCSVVVWSFVPPHRLARWGLGRSPCPVDLLRGDLVVPPTSQTCSVGTWLVNGLLGPCFVAEGPAGKNSFGKNCLYMMPKLPLMKLRCYSVSEDEGSNQLKDRMTFLPMRV